MPVLSFASTRVLEPIDRISEVLFGLIMVLTFTGSMSVADAGRDDVRTMLIGALGCNLAWGVIDGIFFVMGRMAERGTSLATFRSLRAAPTPADGQRIVAGSLPRPVANLLQESELEALRVRLLAMPDPASRRIHVADYWGALGVFLLVFLSTLPVALPFLLIPDVRPAMRASNAVAIVLLFITGFFFGRVSQLQPIAVGLVMVVLGLVLVGLTVALGG
jgi:hypothetical protein